MPVRIIVTEGSRDDCSEADELIKNIKADHLMADKAYDTNNIIDLAEKADTNPSDKPNELKKSVEDAYKKVGISNQRGEEVISKIVSLNLMGYCPCHGYTFPVGAAEKLTALKESVVCTPILNPMEKEIFRRLKSHHANLFPHQLLRTFVPEHVAREVLSKFSDISFGSYLCMEVDFLICDDEYRPIRAVEYQGGYHLDPQQMKKDEFKKEVCEAAGVPLTAYEKSSLWKADELNGGNSSE